MPWFHATHVERIPSILKHGIGSGYARNWPLEGDGVYLASHAEVAVAIMLERYLQFGEPASLPRDELARWRVIVIDDSRVRTELLRVDPEFTGDAEGVSMIYSGTIDVTGMPILDVDALGFKGPPPETIERDALLADLRAIGVPERVADGLDLDALRTLVKHEQHHHARAQALAARTTEHAIILPAPRGIEGDEKTAEEIYGELLRLSREEA